MKLIRFVAFLFYRYYKGGRRPETIPLFHTLCSMTLICFFHVFQVLILMHRVDLIPANKDDGIWSRRLAIGLCMLPIFIALSLVVKKKHMEELEEKYEYQWDKIFNANVWLIIYLILSFALIFVLAFLKK